MKNNSRKILRFYLKIILIATIILVSVIALISALAFKNFSGSEFLPEKAAREMKTVCLGQSPAGTNGCYQGKFKKLASETSFSQAQDTLFALQKIDLETAGDCHMIAHVISQIEATKDSSKWKELIKGQDPQICLGGFIHGVVEEHIFRDNKEKIDTNLIDEVCRVVKEGRGQWNCMHIMGHLILIQENDNMPAAVSICDRIPLEKEPHYCYIGVFMEHTTKLNLISHGIIKNFKLTEKDSLDMESLCRSLKREDASVACWMEMSRMYMSIYNNDFPKVLAACSRAENITYVQYCRNFGSTLWIYTAGTDRVANIKVACSYFEELSTGWKDCIFSGTSGLLDSTLEYVPGLIGFCSTINYYFRETCFMTIGFNLSQKMDLAKRRGFCSAAPEEFKAACTLYYQL